MNTNENWSGFLIKRLVLRTILSLYFFLYLNFLESRCMLAMTFQHLCDLCIEYRQPTSDVLFMSWKLVWNVDRCNKAKYLETQYQTLTFSSQRRWRYQSKVELRKKLKNGHGMRKLLVICDVVPKSWTKPTPWTCKIFVKQRFNENLC